jgi:hypothetical protein
MRSQRESPAPWTARSVLWAKGAALILASVHGLPAQETEPRPQPETFSDVVDVRVVNVEVVVTDRQGVPVRGLRAEDFVLEVDGAPVAIDYFTEVRGGQALTTEGLGATELPAIPTVVAGEPVGTSYLVFVDDHFVFEEDRNRRHVASWLAVVPAGRYLALAAAGRWRTLRGRV